MKQRILVAAIVAIGWSAAAAQEVDERFALGREIFTQRAQPACALCHTLADAGATGEIGPNLDQLAPTPERVLRAVTHGIGPMRPYEGLSEDEKAALAHYVATAAGD